MWYLLSSGDDSLLVGTGANFPLTIVNDIVDRRGKDWRVIQTWVTKPQRLVCMRALRDAARDDTVVEYQRRVRQLQAARGGRGDV